MKIHFTKVTWYSKLLTALFVLIVFPVVSFYIGRSYEEAISKPVISKSFENAVLSSTNCGDLLEQQSMNLCAKENFLVAQEDMEKAYTTLSTHERFTSGFKEKITMLQGKWQIYRDEECKAQSDVYEGGSLAPFILYRCMETFTLERKQVLQNWLEELSL